MSHDFSKEERELVRDLSRQAREKSEASLNEIWRVRGTPGNMKLVKFKKEAPKEVTNTDQLQQTTSGPQVSEDSLQREA